MAPITSLDLVRKKHGLSSNNTALITSHCGAIALPARRMALNHLGGFCAAPDAKKCFVSTFTCGCM